MIDKKTAARLAKEFKTAYDAPMCMTTQLKGVPCVRVCDSYVNTTTGYYATHKYTGGERVDDSAEVLAKFEAEVARLTAAAEEFARAHGGRVIAERKEETRPTYSRGDYEASKHIPFGSMAARRKYMALHYTPNGTSTDHRFALRIAF